MNWKISEKQSMPNSKESVRNYERYIYRYRGVMRRSSIYIIMFEGEKEENGCRQQSKMANFPELMRDMNSQILETHKAPNRVNKKVRLNTHTVQIEKTQDFKSNHKNRDYLKAGSLIHDFLRATMEAKYYL